MLVPSLEVRKMTVSCRDSSPVALSASFFTDASGAGWEAHLQELMAVGEWPGQELDMQINLLKMKTVF